MRRRLTLRRRQDYHDTRLTDPLRFYFVPVLGRLFRRRVELCLTECRSGRRVLEVGFGSGITFPNLDELYDEIHGVDSGARVAAVARASTDAGITTYLQKGTVQHLPYRDAVFDTILLISILEHLTPTSLTAAFDELWRTLAPGGQVVYGVPAERPLMSLAFRGLGYDIRDHHFSTERQVADAALVRFEEVRTVRMSYPLIGTLYEVGHFRKPLESS